MKTFTLFVLIAGLANAELVTLTNGQEIYAVDRDSILSIEPAPTGNQFFSRASNKVITLDPVFHEYAISRGLANGNLRRISPATIIKLGKQYHNTQVTVGGAALIGGGDATIAGASNQIVVNIPVADVIRQLAAKSP